MRTQNIIVNSLNIRYYAPDSVIDTEATLVYLHGWGSRAQHFEAVLNNCPNFVALDLPGFGGSERPSNAWGLDEYADFLRSFLEKLGINNPIIVGHSFGGSIAIKYCSKYRNVTKLILIGSAGIRNKNNVRKKIYYVAAKIFGLVLSLPVISLFKDRVRRIFYKAIDSEDYINSGEMTEIYQKIISQDISNELSGITIPAVLIWGENDKDAPVSDAKKMQSLLPNAKLNIIKDAGHFVFIDKPFEFEKIFFEAIK